IEAPRGPIVDWHRRPIVTNAPGTIVRIWPQDLPKTWSRQLAELRRLATVLKMTPRQVVSLLRGRVGDPLTPVTIKSGVHRPQASYIQEHQDEFRGVDVHSTTLRHYPFQALAAHIVGHVGEISPEQLKEKQYKTGDYRAGDRIGQGGVESVYDSYLRGHAGLAQLRVDAQGRPRGAFKPRMQPQAGSTLRLTLDLELQQAAERAIKYGIRLAHQDGCFGCWASNGGAIVALDPRNGAIRALASYPTFKPSVFVGRVDSKRLDAAGLSPKTSEKKNTPALDRAIGGLYPAGSTFKPITAIAAMQEHIISPYDTLDCTGVYYVRDSAGNVVSHGKFKNWDPSVNQPMTLMTALEASCDTYFYQLGYDFFNLPPDRGHPLQAWAGRFGIGRYTGVDIPGEAKGLLPTPEWRKRTFTKKTDPKQWRVDRLWKPGDSIQLAIGQKDLQLTPLQLARVYAMIANGGKLVTPHIAADVEQSVNDSPPVVLRRFTPSSQDVGVDPGALAAVRDGLYLATHGSSGTATAVFGNFPINIAGKTGTAEKVITLPGWKDATTVNQSWWCGYGPIESPELVVCALIENGGHGGVAAAPAALRVFKKYFHVGSTNFVVPGRSQTD
ncbi:MAG: penicillin-binding protein 2, partial [Actinobacteria bacterium]|nr:penicillin-binding protein 2 [Actinomycetota bacterium]